MFNMGRRSEYWDIEKINVLLNFDEAVWSCDHNHKLWNILKVNLVETIPKNSGNGNNLHIILI